jgi:hypothetical protein
MKRRVSLINTPLILALIILLIALVVVGVWYHNNAEGGLTFEGAPPDGLNQERDPAEAEKRYQILLLYILPLAVMFGLILWRHKR